MSPFLRFCTILLLLFLAPYLPLSKAENPPVSPAKQYLYVGEPKRMGNGTAWSWVETDSQGVPTAIGITFTGTALSGLPEQPPSPELYGFEFDLPLPAQIEVPPFNQLAVDWNPRGHAPPGIYDLPHFDFHFYLLTTPEREKIEVKGPEAAKLHKKPPSQFMPSGYVLPQGTEYPHMGVHWIDPASPEFHNKSFTYTFIYGTYDGKLAFFEPMVSKAFLESRPNVNEPIKQPAAFEKPGFYPAAYRVFYDPSRKEYTVSLQGLTCR